MNRILKRLWCRTRHAWLTINGHAARYGKAAGLLLLGIALCLVPLTLSAAGYWLLIGDLLASTRTDGEPGRSRVSAQVRYERNEAPYMVEDEGIRLPKGK